jgi:hypothetical protein
VLSYSEWEENSTDESGKIPTSTMSERERASGRVFKINYRNDSRNVLKFTAYEIIHETCLTGRHMKIIKKIFKMNYTKHFKINYIYETIHKPFYNELHMK